MCASYSSRKQQNLLTSVTEYNCYNYLWWHGSVPHVPTEYQQKIIDLGKAIDPAPPQGEFWRLRFLDTTIYMPHNETCEPSEKCHVSM